MNETYSFNHISLTYCSCTVDCCALGARALASWSKMSPAQHHNSCLNEAMPDLPVQRGTTPAHAWTTAAAPHPRLHARCTCAAHVLPTPGQCCGSHLRARDEVECSALAPEATAAPDAVQVGLIVGRALVALHRHVVVDHQRDLQGDGMRSDHIRSDRADTRSDLSA